MFFLLLRGDLEGLLGSVAQGLKVENPCFGIIICVLMEVAGLVVIAAWRIPGMGETGGLPSMGLHRVGHD